MKSDSYEKLKQQNNLRTESEVFTFSNFTSCQTEILYA